MLDANTRPETSSGEELRRAREHRGLSIEQVAGATCIASRYLRALEEDAPLHEFPAPVYARFFLREYARHVGADDGALVAGFDARHGEELRQDDLLELPEAVPVRRARWRLVTALSIAGLLVLVGVTLSSRRSPTDVSLSGQTVAGPQTSGTGGEGAGGVRLSDPADVRAVLELRERCWVRAIADGKTVIEETLPAGVRRRLRADEKLELTLGNADGVRLFVDGVRERTGDGVITLTLRLGPHRVRVIRERG